MQEDFANDMGRSTDFISHPPHYTGGKIECIEAIEVMIRDMTGFEGYCLGNVLKYIWRWKAKGGVSDLRKARWYLDDLIAKQGANAGGKI